MNRRQFSIATLVALPLSSRAQFDEVLRVSAFNLELQNLFSVPQHAVQIGRRYLLEHPHKLDRRTLINDAMGTTDARAARRTSLSHLVAQWLERDFRSGTVVVLDGWILARTEVSLCALLYLSERS